MFSFLLQKKGFLALKNLVKVSFLDKTAQTQLLIRFQICLQTNNMKYESGIIHDLT